MELEEKILKTLEDMPRGLSSRLKIWEHEDAVKALEPSHPWITLEDIKIHNAQAEWYAEWYKAAVDKYIEWRNNIYLELKNLLPTPPQWQTNN